MLDIEIIEQPTATAIDIVSLDEFASHLRLSAAARAKPQMQLLMTAALKEAVASLHGFSGVLNRMVLPCRLKRYLTKFPTNKTPIQLPYPELRGDVSITIEDGSSPANVVSPSNYVIKKHLVPEIWIKDSWPQVTAAPRAISVSYDAGYDEYPDDLKRLVKIMAAHNFENPDGTIMEPRQMMINRRVEFGVDYLTTLLRIPVSYDDWLE